MAEPSPAPLPPRADAFNVDDESQGNPLGVTAPTGNPLGAAPAGNLLVGRTSETTQMPPFDDFTMVDSALYQEFEGWKKHRNALREQGEEAARAALVAGQAQQSRTPGANQQAPPNSAAQSATPRVAFGTQLPLNLATQGAPPTNTNYAPPDVRASQGPLNPIPHGAPPNGMGQGFQGATFAHGQGGATGMGQSFADNDLIHSSQTRQMSTQRGNYIPTFGQVPATSFGQNPQTMPSSGLPMQASNYIPSFGQIPATSFGQNPQTMPSFGLPMQASNYIPPFGQVPATSFGQNPQTVPTFGLPIPAFGQMQMTESSPLINVLNNPILLATPHLLSPDQQNLATFTKELRGLIYIDEVQRVIMLYPRFFGRFAVEDKAKALIQRMSDSAFGPVARMALNNVPQVWTLSSMSIIIELVIFYLIDRTCRRKRVSVTDATNVAAKFRDGVLGQESIHFEGHLEKLWISTMGKDDSISRQDDNYSSYTFSPAYCTRCNRSGHDAQDCRGNQNNRQQHHNQGGKNGGYKGGGGGGSGGNSGHGSKGGSGNGSGNGSGQARKANTNFGKAKNTGKGKGRK